METEYFIEKLKRCPATKEGENLRRKELKKKRNCKWKKKKNCPLRGHESKKGVVYFNGGGGGGFEQDVQDLKL